MRAAVYYNNNDIRIEEIPVPGIGNDELLVKVLASGICGSDVMEWYRVKKAPIVLGHEISGKIVKKGQDVDKYMVGDRVFVSHHVPCNNCHYCLNGHHTACDTLRTTNYFPGGFAEYIRVPAINVDRGVFPLPDNISDDAGVFIEPLACVSRAQKTAGLKPGQSVLILGSGISGLLHLLLAKNSGAARIIMTDTSGYKLDFAENLGADAVISASEDVPAVFRRLNEDRLADLVIVCTGALPAFYQALDSVDRGGTVLFFAPTGPGIKLEIPVNKFWRDGITLTHSYGGSPDDIKTAIELLSVGKLSVEKLITHRLSLSEAASGFKLAAEGSECIKVILNPVNDNGPAPGGTKKE